MGVEAVLTTSAATTPAALADLVEYALGNATTTLLGRRRAADGRVVGRAEAYLEKPFS